MKYLISVHGPNNFKNCVGGMGDQELESFKVSLGYKGFLSRLFFFF